MKKVLNRIFVEGLGGMALGLFATLIIGTILEQIGILVKGDIGAYIVYIAKIAKTVTGAGIGVGVAAKLGQAPLVMVSAGVAGMIGAFPLINSPLTFGKPGDALCAFVCAYAAIEVGNIISGKTKLDIILTPLFTIGAGSVVAFLFGPYSFKFTNYMGKLIEWGMEKSPILMSMIVAVLMGMILTLPISSAAIGVMFHVGGLAGGAAVIGCCCQMIGFAVMSYRENKVSGLISQGIGTSMLQIPNIVRKPIIWIPPILSSAILGPIGTVLLKMQCGEAGAGMGTSGLVGQIVTYQTMLGSQSQALILVKIFAMHVILPAILTLIFAEAMRKLNLIKEGDLLLRI